LGSVAVPPTNCAWKIVLKLRGEVAVKAFRNLFELCAKTGPTFSSMLESKRKALVGGSVPSVQRSVLFSSVGEVVEWFDFMVYLSLAPVLARVFFPADSQSSLLVTLGIFGAAFLARPIGAVLFGHLGDRVGRKRAR